MEGIRVMFSDWYNKTTTQTLLESMKRLYFHGIYHDLPVTDGQFARLFMILEAAYDAGVSDENEFWQSHGHHTT